MKYYNLMFSVILMATGCSVQEKFNPQVSFYNDNSLLPAISFSSSDSNAYVIKYWPDGEPDKAQQSGLSTGTEHKIVLTNVTPATTYHYLIQSQSTKQISGTLTFQTKELPFDIVSIKKQNIKSNVFDGYILIRRWAPVGSDVIINNEGNIVWYHLYDAAVRRPFTWTNRNSVLSVYDSAQIVEYDLKANKLMDLKLEDYDIPNMLHHEILYNSSGDIVALTHDSVKMDLRRLGMGANQFVRADGLIVFDKKGILKWKWNLLDVYNPLDFPTRQINLKQSVGHANSVAIGKDGHYIISFRDFSQLWKINASDGSVIWKLGEGGDFKMDVDEYFMRQHAIHFNTKGELMMFDNGDRKLRPNSRVLSLVIDESSKQARISINVSLPTELSADKMCSAEMIENGKYLVCTSKKNGILTVVNDNAEVLWRVDLTSPSYRAYYLSNPFTPN